MQITRKQQDKIDEEMAPKNELEYDEKQKLKRGKCQ